MARRGASAHAPAGNVDITQVRRLPRRAEAADTLETTH
jgi:hypothetical protein